MVLEVSQPKRLGPRLLVLVQIKHPDNGDVVCSYCFMVSREPKETEEGSQVSVPSEVCHLTTYSLQPGPAHQKNQSIVDYCCRFIDTSHFSILPPVGEETANTCIFWRYTLYPN